MMAQNSNRLFIKLAVFVALTAIIENTENTVKMADIIFDNVSPLSALISGEIRFYMVHGPWSRW